MNRDEIRRAFYDEEKPPIKNYIAIAAVLILLVAAFFVVKNYQTIAQSISDGEAPPALPQGPLEEEAAGEQPPTLPGEELPGFPS